jgi:hypothetical protein
LEGKGQTRGKEVKEWSDNNKIAEGVTLKEQG